MSEGRTGLLDTVGGVGRGREDLVRGDRDRPAEGSCEPAPVGRAADAGRLATDVGAPAGQALGRIRDGAGAVADET